MRRLFIVVPLITLGLSAGCSTTSTSHGTSGTLGNGNGQSETSPSRPVVKSPFELIANSARLTHAKRTARVKIEAEIGGESSAATLGRTIKTTMDGRMALDGSRAELIMNLSSFSPGNEGSVPVRIVNGTIYIDFSALVRGLHHSPSELPPALRNVKWINYDVVKLVPGTSNRRSPASYTQYLEYLRGASKDGVDTVGTELIDGVVTTHLKAEIDVPTAIEKIKRQLATAAPDYRSELVASMKSLLRSKSLPIEVWIDADGVVHKITIQMSLPMPDGEMVSLSMSAHLFDFGVAVDDIVAPPASQVGSMKALLRDQTAKFGQTNTQLDACGCA